jgi:hypothetical protein
MNKQVRKHNKKKNSAKQAHPNCRCKFAHIEEDDDDLPFQTCIREEGVLWVLERFNNYGRWIITRTASTVKEQLEDDISLSNHPEFLRICKFVRVPNVTLAS